MMKFLTKCRALDARWNAFCERRQETHDAHNAALNAWLLFGATSAMLLSATMMWYR